MRPDNRLEDHGEGFAPRWASDQSGDAAGPQGEALILELQRLRQAFEQENPDCRHAPRKRAASRDDARPAPAARQRVQGPRRRQKGKMGRVIDVWLEQFGWSGAAAARRRNETARGPAAVPPQRGRAPAVTPDDRPSRNRAAAGPDIAARDARPPKARKEAARGPAAAPPQRARGPIVTLDDPPIPNRKAPEPKTFQNVDRDRPLKAGKETARGTAAEPPQHARGPIIAHDDPSLLNRTTLVPEIPAGDLSDRLPNIESLRLAPPIAAAPPAAETSMGRLVGRCRDGLVSGVAFLANRDGLADNDNAPDETLTVRAGRSFENELRTGLRVLIAVGVLAGGWLALVPLSGAVVVPGNLVVQSNVKTIQHPTGGVVAEIAVHDGMRVSAGDLLVRLDATQAKASLQMVSKQLDEVRAKIARLLAERDGLPQPEIPPDLSARVDDSSVKTLLASETSQFNARAGARDSQKDILERRVTQLGEEIVGLEAQVGSKAKQLELIAGELTGVQDLYDKRLVPLTRLTTLQRESARIDGERGQLISSIAETKSKIGEARLQIVKIDQDFQTEVVKDLGEAQGKEAELVEHSVAARDLLDRIEVRAPTSGVIHQLAAHTIGGVIKAGDAIMEVVPDSDDLQIEAHLQPKDIDQVRNNQKAFVRFPAFNQRVTPQIAGIVNYVSADTSKDPRSDTSFFTVRISLPDEERRRLAGLQLVSGMPAEVFLQTGSRTMLTYLLKPITDQLRRAFVER
jgi:membrane fusion protein, type I secretion system